MIDTQLPLSREKWLAVLHFGGELSDNEKSVLTALAAMVGGKALYRENPDGETLGMFLMFKPECQKFCENMREGWHTISPTRLIYARSEKAEVAT